MTPVGSSSCHLSLAKDDWVNVSGIWWCFIGGAEAAAECGGGGGGEEEGRMVDAAPKEKERRRECSLRMVDTRSGGSWNLFRA